jgi:hypothetical protein
VKTDGNAKSKEEIFNIALYKREREREMKRKGERKEEHVTLFSSLLFSSLLFSSLPSSLSLLFHLQLPSVTHLHSTLPALIVRLCALRNAASWAARALTWAAFPPRRCCTTPTSTTRHSTTWPTEVKHTPSQAKPSQPSQPAARPALVPAFLPLLSSTHTLPSGLI